MPICLRYSSLYIIFILITIQSTPLNRVTLVPEHFDPIKRNLGVDPIKRSELILFLWFRSWPRSRLTGGPSLTGDPIKRSRLYNKTCDFSRNYSTLIHVKLHSK